jgi:hypothetical protein
MDVPPAIVALALHPFRDLPPAPGTELIERDGILLAFHPYPIAQPVEPLALTAEDVPVAVAAARVAARERGKRVLAWWIAPEHDHLRAALEEEELVNEDTPGFEAVENAMYSQPGNPGRQYLAKIGDEFVGTAGASFGDAGINLFGGAVLPHARARGVYRALTVTRWAEAVRRGRPP